MKQKIYILGLITTVIIYFGLLFKTNHWPGAGYLLSAGLLAFVFIFLPMALRSHYIAEGEPGNRILYIVTWVTSFVIFISTSIIDVWILSKK